MIGNQLPFRQQVLLASSAEEGSFLLLLQPGKGWRFSSSSSHCVFPVLQASQLELLVLNLLWVSVSP